LRVTEGRELVRGPEHGDERAREGCAVVVEDALVHERGEGVQDRARLVPDLVDEGELRLGELVGDDAGVAILLERPTWLPSVWCCLMRVRDMRVSLSRCGGTAPPRLRPGGARAACSRRAPDAALRARLPPRLLTGRVGSDWQESRAELSFLTVPREELADLGLRQAVRASADWVEIGTPLSRRNQV
jgi:hypothetical protein